MRILGNVLWFLCGGLIFGLLGDLAGLLLCMTIVGIAVGEE